MTVVHTLPELGVRNSGGRSRRRRAQKIPTLSDCGRCVRYPDAVVGAAIWLHKRGDSYAKIAQALGVRGGDPTVRAWCEGRSRCHVVERQPDEVVWNWVRSHA